MKRTSLTIDEQLLQEAQRLSGERSYSKTVDRALHDFVKRIKARRILELRGRDLWRGSLDEMRGDQPGRATGPVAAVRQDEVAEGDP